MRLNGQCRKATREATKNQGGLIGWKAISQYSGLCRSALDRYRHSDGFPVCHLPDKRMFTTKRLVDQWVMARMMVEQELVEKRDCSGNARHTPDNDLEPTDSTILS